MKPFKPSWWSNNPHIQTLLPTLLRRSQKISTYKQRIKTDDGDFLDLAWSAVPVRSVTTPIVLMFHGLEGSKESPYIKGLIREIRRNEWIGVVMHFRGCSGEPNKTTRSYHSGETEDIGFIINYLRKTYPGFPLIAVGYSLGGNALLKYLGEKANNSKLDAAIAVSVPFELHTCAVSLESGFSRVYLNHLMQQLIASTQTKMDLLDYSNVLKISKENLGKLKTFQEFDDAVTAPIHGFQGANDYYTKSSSRQYLKDIKTPTLILHAEDDPFLSPDVIPAKSELSDSTEMELSRSGGHVGFVYGSSPFAPRFWLEERIPEYIRSCLKIEMK